MMLKELRPAVCRQGAGNSGSNSGRSFDGFGGGPAAAVKGQLWSLEPKAGRIGTEGSIEKSGPDTLGRAKPIGNAAVSTKSDPGFLGSKPKNAKERALAKAAAEAAEKAAKEAHAKAAMEKKRRAAARLKAPPPFALVLDVAVPAAAAAAATSAGGAVAADLADSPVVLRSPLTRCGGGAVPAALASDAPVESQEWWLTRDGLVVSKLGANGFCLGLASTGRIFPSDGSAVVLVPRDSKRALRWTLPPQPSDVEALDLLDSVLSSPAKSSSNSFNLDLGTSI